MISWQNWAPRIGFAGSRKVTETVLRGFAGRFWDGPVSSAWYYPPPGRGTRRCTSCTRGSSSRHSGRAG
jgi:hypothetical protein